MVSEVYQCKKIISDDIVEIRVGELNDFNSFRKCLPQGVYTTLRTYKKTYAIHLSEQFERLEESVQLNSLDINIDRNLVRSVIRQMVKEQNLEELRIRIWIDLSLNIGDIYIIIEQLQTPTAFDYANGVIVDTIRAERENPKSKSSSFLSRSESLKKSTDNKVHETIMVSKDGTLLEGLSSNFFAILDGTVWTEYSHVLDGITRRDALTAISNLGLSIHPNGLNLGMVPRIQEAFITSASRGILPVVKIDATPVGDGKVGKYVCEITDAYQKLVESLLEPI